MSFLVNGYPNGERAAFLLEKAQRRRAAVDRWRRMNESRRLRAILQGDHVPRASKLDSIDPLTLLDCSYAAQDLFNAVPRLSQTDQATFIDYVEMRLEMWRKAQATGTAPTGSANGEKT